MTYASFNALKCIFYDKNVLLATIFGKNTCICQKFALTLRPLNEN